MTTSTDLSRPADQGLGSVRTHFEGSLRRVPLYSAAEGTGQGVSRRPRSLGAAPRRPRDTPAHFPSMGISDDHAWGSQMTTTYPGGTQIDHAQAVLDRHTVSSADGLCVTVQVARPMRRTRGGGRSVHHLGAAASATAGGDTARTAGRETR